MKMTHTPLVGGSTLAHLGGLLMQNDPSFCSVGRGNQRCVPSTETHTFSCQRREWLGRTILDYLRDVREDQRRVDTVRVLGRELLPADVSALFLEWYRIESTVRIGVSEVIANILIHRMIPDMGEFSRVFEVAQQVRAQELLAGIGQETIA